MDIVIPPNLPNLDYSDRGLLQTLVLWDVTIEQVMALSPYFPRLTYLLPYFIANTQNTLSQINEKTLKL